MRNWPASWECPQAGRWSEAAGVRTHARQGHRAGTAPRCGAANGRPACPMICCAAIRQARRRAAGPRARVRRCWRSAVPVRGCPAGQVRPAARRSSAARWTARRRRGPPTPGRQAPGRARRWWLAAAAGPGSASWPACRPSIWAARRAWPPRRRTSPAPAAVPYQALQWVLRMLSGHGGLPGLFTGVILLAPWRMRRHSHQPTLPTKSAPSRAAADPGWSRMAMSTWSRRLPAGELALHGPAGGKRRQCPEAGRGGEHAATGTAGRPAQAAVATWRASPVTM